MGTATPKPQTKVTGVGEDALSLVPPCYTAHGGLKLCSVLLFQYVS